MNAIARSGGNPPERPEARRRVNRRPSLRPSIPQTAPGNHRRQRSGANTDNDRAETRHGDAGKPKRDRSTPQQELERRPSHSDSRQRCEFAQIRPQFTRISKRGILLGKTLENFDFRQLPGLSRARIRSFAESTEWLDRAENLLAFGNSGSGKTHLLSGIGRALVGSGRRVLFTPASSMLEQLKRAQTDLDLERLFLCLDKFDLLILDDFSYVRRSQNETAVLFELVSRRYERRSLAVAANQPFSEWTGIFPDAAMLASTCDRLVHHGQILELNAESFRQKAARERAKQQTRRQPRSRRRPRRRRARPIETLTDVAYAPSVRGSPWLPRGVSGALSDHNKKEASKASVANG